MTAAPVPGPRAARLALALRADLATAEVFRALAADGLDALLLRGPAVARLLYAEGDRGYGDSDLLVPEEQVARVEAALRRLGFASYTERWIAQHWRRVPDGAEIDVHVSLVGVRRPPSALWRALADHRHLLDVYGVPVPVPDEPATAFVVALHAAQHGAVVDHAMVDLGRALERLDGAAWHGAAGLAAASGSRVAFVQALTMLPAGRARLAELGLAPSVSVRSALRRRGVPLPNYLLEALSPAQRLRFLRQRVAPGRDEVAAYFDRRAADSTRWLVAAHARRLVRLPGRTARLVGAWRQAYVEARAFRQRSGHR
jgi:Uncharacterised nucleotidyltransferase